MQEERRNESHFFIKISSPLKDGQFVDFIDRVEGFGDAQIYCLGNDRRRVETILEELNRFFTASGLNVRFSYARKKGIKINLKEQTIRAAEPEKKKVANIDLDSKIIEVMKGQAYPDFDELAKLFFIPKEVIIIHYKALEEEGLVPKI